MAGADNAAFDVAICGYGPAGATLARLLGLSGIRVLVVDRLTGVYDKPRAFAMDHEIMRVFQNIGLADAIAPHVAPFTASEHYGVDGQLIRRLTMIDPPYPLGWIPSMVFRQPPLEEALRRSVSTTPGVTVSLGEELVSFTQDTDQVTLTLQRGDSASGESTRSVTARYLVGCDGASSTVRRSLGIAHDDLAFDEPWLVVDVGVNEKGAAKLPKASAQFCEPSRPTTFLIGVGEHRRWEIMLMPGETPQDFETDAAVWKLLSRWLTPEDGTLWRRASYRFHALVASRWREGRVFLAGDAAHQQPPFLGQGMCQGIRDVANLAWKLTAVLQGRANDGLLDTYGVERAAHVKRLTTTIKHIGHTICERDEAKARQRDADLIAAAGGTVKSVPRQDLIPPLDGGLLAPATPAAAGTPEARGTLFPQPRVNQQGRNMLLDDVMGTGLRLVLGAACDAAAVAALPAVKQSGADVMPIGVVQIGGPGLAEADGIVAAWLARHHATAALVRPDHYVYGVAQETQQINALVLSFHAACNAASSR